MQRIDLDMKRGVALAVSFLLLSASGLIAEDENSAFDDFQRLVQAAAPSTVQEALKRDHPGSSPQQQREQFEKKTTESALAIMERATELEKRYPQNTRLVQVRSSVKQTLSMVFGFMGLPIPRSRVAEVEACTRGLLAAGGKDAGLHMVLFRIATALPNEQQRARFEELSHGPTSERASTSAKAALRNLERLGLPLNLNFNSPDGHVISLEHLKGKVVLIDFWAPACGPCVRDLAGLKELYAKYRAQGLEIVGISKDPDEEALGRFVEKNQLPWPQKYDGSASTNQVAEAYGIVEIPVVWLVDRHGLLRDLDGREDQERKIAALLKEP